LRGFCGGGLSDGDSEIQVSFAVKVDMLRIRNGAVTQPGIGHTWPGALTPVAFDFFDSH
jgi:hypothetical protein